LKANTAAQKDATEIRKTENAAFMAESGEATQAIGALEKTFSMFPGAALVQSKDKEGSAQALAEHVRLVVRSLPPRALMLAQPNTLSMLRTSVKKLANEHKISDNAPFEASHLTLKKILEALHKEIKDDLDMRTAEERQNDQNFEDLMAEKQKEKYTLHDAIATRETRKAEVLKELSAASTNYDDTDTQMRRDVEFFDEVKGSCESKQSEWAARQKLRMSEISGITEALSILTSDAAREMFAKSIKPGFEAFIQLMPRSSGSVAKPVEQAGAKPPVEVAFQVLKAAATRVHSTQLAKLAASVKVASEGAGKFTAVITELDKIVANLKDEAAADVAKRDECKDTYHSIARAVADLDWKLEKNEAKLAEIQVLVEETEATQAAALRDIEAVTRDISDMEAQRKEETEAFEQAKSDDEAAIALLNEAKAALQKFYEENDIDASGDKEAALVQRKGPEFERDEDNAPDAEFSEAGSKKGPAKGIVSLLTMIAEDLENEVKNAESAEKKAQTAYEEQLALAKKMKEDLIEKETNTRQEIDGHREDESNEETSRSDNVDSKDSELKIKADIQPDCDFITKNFDVRAERRATEVEALRQAKDMLRGADVALAKEDAMALIGRPTSHVPALRGGKP